MTEDENTPVPSDESTLGTQAEAVSRESWGKRHGVSLVVFVVSVAMIGWFFVSWLKVDPTAKKDEPEPRSFAVINPDDAERVFVHYWDGVPVEAVKSGLDPGDISNIRSADYVGSEACETCHSEIHGDWSKTYHNSTYLEPSADSVKGNFSGDSTIEYLGGKATFYQEGDEYRMRLVRGDIGRTYKVTGAIGGRFVQAYSGRLLDGPEPEDHFTRLKDLHLPFDYWIDGNQWVPPAHPGGATVADDERNDPFGAEGYVVNFDKQCAVCHTTRPLGDWLISDSGRTRALFHANRSLGFVLGPYMARNHPDIVDPDKSLRDTPEDLINEIIAEMDNVSVQLGAVSRGVACEACHNGCLQHVRDSTAEQSGQPFRHFASSQFIIITGLDAEQAWGRNADNLNFMCARCHSDERPRYANGMSTWHGASISDADRGHCYHAAETASGPQSQLTCVQCHDPHKSVGRAWSETSQQEDARCVHCHQQYENEETLRAHTHHMLDGSGSRCMNCHMPKMIEGQQGVLRTHMIFSPTDVKMLESNQPNACNLCHLDKSIDWTVDHLKQWYRATEDAVAPKKASEVAADDLVSDEQLAANYPQRDGQVGLGWLRSYHSATRLVAIEALCKSDATWALGDLIESLDDEILVNRMFAQKNLEEMLGVSMKDYGYHFYMTPTERREPLARIRSDMLKQADTETSDSNGDGP